MHLGTYLLGIVVAAIATGFILEMLRRGILREKFAALWLAVSATVLVLAVFPGVLTWLADLMGIAVPTNLLFFVAAVVLLMVSVQLSYEVSKLEARTRRLAEDLALLREEVGGTDRIDDAK